MLKDFNNLGSWLPKQLKRYPGGISVERLANRAGISRTALYRWMQDQDRPDEQSMIRVCQALGLPPEEGFRQYVPKREGRPPLYDDKRKRGRR